MTNQEDIYDDMSKQEVVQIDENQAKEYMEAQKLRDAIVTLNKNKNFKALYKSFVDDSLIQLGLNLGIQPQMRSELVLQIEARRIFREFLNTVIMHGDTADEILGGSDGN